MIWTARFTAVLLAVGAHACSTGKSIAQAPAAWKPAPPRTTLLAQKIGPIHIAPRPSGWVTAIAFEGRASLDGLELEGEPATVLDERWDGVAIALIDEEGRTERAWRLGEEIVAEVSANAQKKWTKVTALEAGPNGDVLVGWCFGYIDAANNRVERAFVQWLGPNGDLRERLELEGPGASMTSAVWTDGGWVFLMQFYRQLEMNRQVVTTAKWAGAAIVAWAAEADPRLLSTLDGAQEYSKLAAVDEDVIATGFFSPTLRVGPRRESVPLHEAKAFAARLSTGDGTLRWFRTYAGDSRAADVGSVVDGELLLGVVWSEGVNRNLIVSAEDGTAVRKLNAAPWSPAFEEVTYNCSPSQRFGCSRGDKAYVIERDGTGRTVSSRTVPIFPRASFVKSRAARSGENVGLLLVTDIDRPQSAEFFVIR